MMKFAIAFAVVGSLALAGCGGASCKKIETPKTCSPACKTDPMEFCDNGTCKELKTCSPACKDTEICNALTGACEAKPKTCSPACSSTQYCEDGTCKDNPVCSPVCKADEVCSN